MNRITRQWTKIAAGAMVALASLCGSVQSSRAQTPSWLSNAVIYCVQPEIFSVNGIKGVTAQLSRLHNLGVNVIWLMPIYPRGNPITIGSNSYSSFNSPYDIENFEGIDPAEGTSADLTNLVSTAHSLGMKVILDVALNCTSWDNPLVQTTPQYYIHTDGNVNNVASIQDGWGTETDVAQLNLSTDTYGAQTYVTNVCKYWVTNYGIDGFRFDSADNPQGTTRSFPESLAQKIQSAIGTNELMLGEEEDVALALAPYGLDYGWNMWYYGVDSAFGQNGGAYTLQYQWQYPYTRSNTSPAGILHMNIQDDWDLTNRDVVTLGGYPQAMAAAVFDCSTSGVPLIYNGMEVANNNGGNNPHTQINWSGSQAYNFQTFYQQLLALRNNSAGALQQGTTTWVTNSSNNAVSTYDRTGGGQEYLIEINTTSSAQSGTVSAPAGGAWIEVTPAGAPGGQIHTNPGTGNFSLQGWDFAIFQRSSAGQPAATPSFSLTPGTYTGNQSLAISDATAGATIYYTTDGTTPTTASTRYTGPITLTTVETVEAIAVGAASSQVRTGVYKVYSGSGGSLSGTESAITTAQTINLTSQGSSDWAMWGYKASFNYEHSSSGNGQISNLGVYGGGGAGQFTNSLVTTSWTNGSPDTSVSNCVNGYYNGGGVGDGFIFTAPADTNTRTLTVYLGGWQSGGTLTATLSDNSAPAYTNSSLVNTSTNYYGVYTLTYKAANANQTLTVTWTHASGSGNVTIQAATLQGNATPTAATPTFSPAPGTYAGAQSVTMSDSTSGSTIYYTTDGSAPTTSSTKYTGAITVSSTETINAMAAASGYNNSAVASGTYTINLPQAATPTFSPAPGSYAGTQTVTLSDSTPGATIYYTTDGTTPTTSSTKYTAAISVSTTETINAIATASGYSTSAVASGTYTIVPAAPTGLTATAGNAQVSLSWTGSTGATSYNLYRSTTTGGEGTTPFVTGITGTTYTNTGLTNGTTYYFKVAAVNSAGTSAQSTEASATPVAPTEAPYGGTPWAIPGTIQAENYDTGGQGLGYNVTSVNGTANSYRTDGVDLESCSDTGGGYDVGWSASGQWFRYTVNVGAAGTYSVSLRVANGSGSSASMHLQNSAGTNLSGAITVPTTGGWQTWTTVTASVTLPEGQQVLTVYQDSANINLNSLTFAQTGGEAPYGGTAASIPGTVQAENYDTGGQGVGYSVTFVNGTANSYRTDGVDLESCSDTGGGYDVGWAAAGQWFRYTVNVATAGTYTVALRVANGSGGSASMHLQNASGTNLSGSITVPNTGGWQTWTTVYASVTLPAGQQVLTVYQDSANINLNYLTFSSGSLSGSATSVTSATTYNLTAQGTTDWAAWGYNGTDRDSSGGSKIGALSVAGAGSLNSFTSSFLGFTWTNGTPDASVTGETKGYYNNAGVGDGFSFTAPASPTIQTLTVYVGGWSSGGTLTASLSDGSAATYTDSSMVNTGNSYYGYYTLTYSAGSANQTLTVTWKQNQGTGNVTVYAAALH